MKQNTKAGDTKDETYSWLIIEVVPGLVYSSRAFLRDIPQNAAIIENQASVFRQIFNTFELHGFILDLLMVDIILKKVMLQYDVYGCQATYFI